MKFWITAILVVLGIFGVLVLGHYQTQSSSQESNTFSGRLSGTLPDQQARSANRGRNAAAENVSGVPIPKGFIDEPATLPDLNTPAWTPSKSARENYAAELPADFVNGEFLQLERAILTHAQEGDLLAITIPQVDAQYTLQVDQIVTHPNGDRTLRGHLTEFDEVNEVAITLGDEQTFATISTPTDTFQLEGFGNSAWIASRSDMRRRHDRRHSDEVIPTAQPVTPPTL